MKFETFKKWAFLQFVRIINVFVALAFVHGFSWLLDFDPNKIVGWFALGYAATTTADLSHLYKKKD